jgi:hypothetical protein
MKVFITVEVEEGDLGKGIMSEKTYIHMMKTISLIRKEGIPVQYKDTNIPRFQRASEI